LQSPGLVAAAARQSPYAVVSLSGASTWTWATCISGVLAKVREEAEELAAARDASDVEHELGDLLFTVVNLARHLKVDPEQALRKSNARFRRRFAHVEQSVAQSGKAFAETPLEKMEEWWQEAKSLQA
jgi:uncharacterized protein YabN with tetrapyrrole methylase and pyrophosphatase domain